MFTQKQVNELLENENVCKCSSGIIVYSGEFKVKSVVAYINDGLSPNKIFKKAGFDLDVIGKNKPCDCLRRWRKVYESRGKKGLLGKDKQNPSKKRSLVFKSAKEEILYLKTKIKYLDAENDFLAKLRGLKREQK